MQPQHSTRQLGKRRAQQRAQSAFTRAGLGWRPPAATLTAIQAPAPHPPPAAADVTKDKLDRPYKVWKHVVGSDPSEVRAGA